ncbi:hypothetical protein [Desulfosporosinus lacus]|uniref:Uncharacterized protein n=1 Tax=Desulfosporosinus lacus DSM 15449 TaxID=1121420 RepID=A0A1M6GRT7_9FIRM|nr:hypothetical protein [Desulfosporosinus lacus]SHJ12632.1 hypothetical protein SAMN02746098_05202 [Desulfosporosinus lacus DSM 15449]
MSNSSIMGKKGCEKTGFFSGLVGTIERYSDQSFLGDIQIIEE